MLKCKQLINCAVFDCWIGNADRFPQNLLFDGSSEIRLIDHDDALPDYLLPRMPIKCQLIEMLAADMPEIELHRFKKNMLSLLPKINEIDFQDLKQSVPYSLVENGEVELDRALSLLQSRLPMMNMLLNSALGIGQYDLNLEASEMNTESLANDE